jgi:hypothetical protein
VLVLHSSGQQLMYLNGVLTMTAMVPLELSTFTYNYLGATLYDNDPNMLSGSIDEVRIWSTALKPYDIVYHTILGPNGKLKLCCAIHVSASLSYYRTRPSCSFPDLPLPVLPTMSYAFDGNATNIGTYVSILTTFGRPEFVSQRSRAGVESAVYFANTGGEATNATSGSYYEASTHYAAPLTVMAWLRCDLSFNMTPLGLRSSVAPAALGFEIEVSTTGRLSARVAAPSPWALVSEWLSVPP